MKQLLQNLPKNFIEETFVTSPNYISYLIQWVQDNGKDLHLYNVVKPQKFHGNKSNDMRNERKVLDLVVHTLDKFNIDLFEVAATGKFEIFLNEHFSLKF